MHKNGGLKKLSHRSEGSQVLVRDQEKGFTESERRVRQMLGYGTTPCNNLRKKKDKVKKSGIGPLAQGGEKPGCKELSRECATEATSPLREEFRNWVKKVLKKKDLGKKRNAINGKISNLLIAKTQDKISLTGLAPKKGNDCQTTVGMAGKTQG